MATCLIGLGSNLGDRRTTLERAVSRLRQHAAIQVSAVSSWHSYPAVGGPAGQGSFLNGAARLITDLSPHELRQELHRIERDAGRQRADRWAARTLDVDLLLYDRQIVTSPELKVPHPRMATRRFVLEPAAEVASEMVHPLTRWTIGRLLQHLGQASPYFAITGLVSSVIQRVAEAVVEKTDALLVDVRGDGSVGSSPAPFHPRELALSRRRCAALESSERSADLQRPRISNFWIMQSAAFARELLAAADAELFQKQLQTWNRFPPKLVVLLDAPALWIGQQLARQTVSDVQKLKEQLDRQLSVDVKCPALVLEAQNLDRAVQDFVAAMTAMQ